jgi:tRNA threonylcarbamoyladenosine biosynthesis protein TsaE
VKIELPTLEATDQFARALANAVASFTTSRAVTIALSGTLGAGKTQWVRYFGAALDIPALEVTSPTYVLLQRYSGRKTVYHFDFYRLETIAQVWDLGIDELFEQPLVVVIEWAEKFLACLPEDHLRIELFQNADGLRHAVVSATGSHAELLDTLAVSRDA